MILLSSGSGDGVAALRGSAADPGR